jgi:hypothetical protein
MQFFEIFAECSIALLGFGAVHAVLRGSDGPRGTVRAWVVVSHGSLAFILCVLPLLLTQSSLSPEMLWRTSSAIGVIGAGALLYTVMEIDRRLTALGYPPQAPLNIFLAKFTVMIAILAMLLNFIGWPWKPDLFLHALAVTLTLVSGLLALHHTFVVPIQRIFTGNSSKQTEDAAER